MRLASSPLRRAARSVLLAALSCDGGAHVYQGRLFLEERQCLGTTSSLDVVSGEPTGDCGPRCLVQPGRDGGRAIYVATMCPPLPYGFDASGSDPACPAALAALARGDTCFVDGGSSQPASNADAGRSP